MDLFLFDFKAVARVVHYLPGARRPPARCDEGAAGSGAAAPGRFFDFPPQKMVPKNFTTLLSRSKIIFFPKIQKKTD